MKHLMTLIALVVAVTAGAQGTTIHEYPWNPDWNNDNYIGSQDLTGFLSAFGSEFGNPPEPCDYDGTPLEELMAGITNGDIILDSIFIEYELEDISSYYIVGCPDPITDTLIFANQMLLNNFNNLPSEWIMQGIDSYGFISQFHFTYDATLGLYEFVLNSSAISYLGFENDGFFGSSWAYSENSTIPFPEDWYLDDEGIHIDADWNESEWVHYTNYIHILPYWHYAE